MKIVLVFVVCLLCLNLNAQLQTRQTKLRHQNETYFSFNPFGLLEPQIAVGFGFGKRFSLRSEYFTELSYLNKNPLYNENINSFRGIRFLAQYRYHFLQRWESIRLRSKEKIAKLNPFIGFEFRLKRFQFSDKANFVDQSTRDTLSNFLYTANATSLGGAVVFGHSYDVSGNGKWKIEISAGVGVKQKLVNIVNPTSGYTVMVLRKVDWGFPNKYESVSTPYFPFAIRLQYVIH